MIRRVDEKSRDRFLALLAPHACAGVRMETAFACYAHHPQVAGFYLNENAALMTMGTTALLCGEWTDTEELAAFLDFAGVCRVENAPALPGFAPTGELLLCRPARPVCAAPEAFAPAARAERGRWTPAPQESELGENLALPLTLAPDLWQLRCAALLETDPDGWYADACLRRRQGAVIAAVGSENAYWATAGLYAQNAQNAYLTGVATAPKQRGKGLATGLVQTLCDSVPQKNVWLLCDPALQGLYGRCGFLPVGSARCQKRR